jgi:hypothetical protein
MPRKLAAGKKIRKSRQAPKLKAARKKLFKAGKPAIKVATAKKRRRPVRKTAASKKLRPAAVALALGPDVIAPEVLALTPGSEKLGQAQ